MRLILTLLIVAGIVSAQDISFRRKRPAASSTSLTFTQYAGSGDWQSSTTVATTITGVASGAGIICAVGGNTTTNTISVADNSSNALTSRYRYVGGRVIEWFSLASSTSGNRTFTATYSGSTDYRMITCFEVAYSGGTLTLDQSSGANSAGSTESITTGNITTTAAGLSIVSYYPGSFHQFTPTSPQINGTAATAAHHTSINHDAYNWYLSSASTFTGQGTATGASYHWAATITHWKVTP